jgi:hypothetical protein
MRFSKIFKPNPREITLEEENKLLSDNITSTLHTTKRPFTIKEVRVSIKKPESKTGAGLPHSKPHNQSNTAEDARNVNKITLPNYNAVRRGFFPPQ